MKKSSKKLDPIEIKIALLKKGITQQDIANKLGVKRQTVNVVINKGYRSKRVENELMKILDDWNAAI